MLSPVHTNNDNYKDDYKYNDIASKPADDVVCSF